MKAETLQQRLEKRYTGSKSSKSYRIVKDLIYGTNETFAVKDNVIRPCSTSGQGRFTTNLDYTSMVMHILSAIGVKYEFGNDAPRGAKTGNYIKITTKIQY